MKVLVSAILLFVVSLSTFAGLSNAPEWRGQERTTYQLWNFDTDNPNPFADEYSGPFNVPTAEVIPAPNHFWESEIHGRTGVWPLSGNIYVPLENYPEPLDYKIIWIQLIWRSKGGQPQVEASGDQGPYVAGQLIQSLALENQWYESTYEVILRPNPADEIVHIYGEIHIDVLEIDTICTPEPTSLGLLGLGAIALIRKRR